MQTIRGIDTRYPYAMQMLLSYASTRIGVGTFVILMAVLLITRSAPLPRDPLTDYMSVVSQVTLEDLRKAGYSCDKPDSRLSSLGAHEVTTCVLGVAEGPIASIQIIYEPISDQRYTVCQAVFSFRDTSIRLGHLVLLWGKPHQDYPRLRWHSHNISITMGRTQHFDYRMAIELIYLDGSGC